MCFSKSLKHETPRCIEHPRHYVRMQLRTLGVVALTEQRRHGHPYAYAYARFGGS